MHIPDAALSPQTALPALAVMAPLWALAAARVRRALRLRQAPLVALGAAFTFVIMLFNVPIPGGSSGHAVGAVLVAILLGPWAALLAVSLALAVQAVLFADGGVLAFGANCLTMAVVMPFTGWGIYRLLAGNAPPGSRRHLLAAGAAGYLGLNAAALATAVLFGIQPLVAHDAAGRALYFPYGLAVTVPVMTGEHLLAFGWVEALVTGLTLVYLQRTTPELLATVPEAPRARWLYGGLAALVLLSPFGLLVPRWLHAGGAWGENGAPWVRGLLPNYTLPGQAPVLGYLLAGLLGAGVILLLALALMRGLAASRRSPVRGALGVLLRLIGTLLDDRLAVQPGLLQRLDARVKTLALVLLIVAAALLHSLPALAALYALALLLVAASRIPVGHVLGAWLAMPLLTVLVMLPAALNVITPGAPAWTLGHGLAVTDAGSLVVARLALRALAGVTLALLLVSTTPPARLFHGLRALGVPRGAVMQLAMMARYLVVLARAAEEIHLARLSRTLAPGALRQEQAWVAAGMGALYRRARVLGDDVYLAMLSRGYTGEAHLLDPPRAGWREWAFLAGMAAMGSGLLAMDWLWR